MKDLKGTIKLLDHIHENPETTQRELVEKLDISLGKVNFIINALVKKGIIKIERFKSSRNKLGYLYIITPKGMIEKAQITRKFLEKKINEYNLIRREIEQLKSQISEKEI